MACSRNLIREVSNLKKTQVGRRVRERVREFQKVGRKPAGRIFSELCFCILTANFNAERAIEIQNKVKKGFITLSEKKLAELLKNLGYRFPNTRARYIVEARVHRKALNRVLATLQGDELREWFVKNVKGLGFKEASHFLRNIGFKDYAIIDFHIVDVLVGAGLIERPKVLSKDRYIEVEDILRTMAFRLKLNLAELDLYLWYLETKKVLK
jgi:N-glycosylase/DNA lyase